MRSKLILLLATLVMTTSVLAFGSAKGSMLYKSKAKDLKVTFTHAFLIKGPDVVDPKTILRRLLLTTSDIGAKIQACATMSCVDGVFTEGLQVDFDNGPRLNYWLTLNDSLVQYSGTEPPASLTATANTAARLAGKLVFDKTAAGGPKVDVEFDSPLVKEFTKVR